MASTSIANNGDRAEMESYMYEKHLHHQEGVAGTLSIRLVEARNLRPATSLFWLHTCNPYVIFRVGKQHARSSTIQSNDNPKWRRELVEFKVPKLDFSRNPLPPNSNEQVELTIDVMNEDSLAGRATQAVGMAGGSVIGTALMDVTDLLEGKEDILDRWVSLSGAFADKHGGNGKEPEKELLLGEVRVIVQYEPFGMEPRVGDIVKMEGFGPYPSAILPPIEDLELEVKRVSGSYVLCEYKTASGFEAMLRLHRNTVFVVHRSSIVDRVYVTVIARPCEFVASTPIGQAVILKVKPYFNVARTVGGPALIAFKTTLVTTVRASLAASKTLVDAMQ